MANRNYTTSGKPTFNTLGASKDIRDEFAAVDAGFAGVEAELDDKVRLSVPSIPNLPAYADNAAALAAGLTAGRLYRQGDLLAIVHA